MTAPAWWPPMYRDILADFGWDEDDDRAAAEALRDALPAGRSPWLHVGTELKHRAEATVVGCGPSLLDAAPVDLRGVVVAADGATERLRELGIIPRVVVTDLDGDLEALRWAGEQGAAIVVHAHGHNRDRLPGAAALGPFVVGTYQCGEDEALAPLRNLGGFTDGDRAVALCAAYQVRRVRLVGFDLDSPPSRYSGTFDATTKPQKLAWAGQIIDRLHGEGLAVERVTPRPAA